MLSLLSRLRGNKHRRTPERNPTPTEFREPAASTSVYFPTPRHALDRPIVANPADLLEPHERNDPVPRGLTPPRTPKRSVVERIPTDESDDLNGLADQQHTSTETQNHTMYSTFGRNNAYGTPTQVHQDSSTLSLTRNDHSVCSPSNTRSSQYNSAHSHQSRTQTQSSTTRSTHSIRSRSADRSVPRDSPYTFGKPSPSFRTRSPSGYFSASASLAEPLPSFSHPELISALSSRSQTRSRTFDSLSVRRSNHWIPPIHGNTYPPHRRNKTNDDTQDSNMLRRSLRAYASLPKNVFRTISSTPTELRRESSRPRTRTISNRRESAEWNAQQATTGVTSPRASEFGWPAEAAQEMVMLSIGEGTSRGRSANAEPRDPHARSESPGRCYPSRHIPSQSPPSFALLQESSDGRDMTLSHRYTPAENLREADDSVMTRQADTNVTASTPRKTGSPRAVRKGKARTRRVSHSSSNSAAASTSKVLQPSRSSSLHNSSLPPTPTSKLKTTIRPIRSASEPRLKSVLETPQNTKGKRKADDLEVTPPDSKNGQHATFAIPPESRRSQIISESSRPPSSYYRKRPRLSDPSTPTPSPAHSRPGSTQKPPATAAANASWPSRTSGAPQAHSSLASRSASMRSARRPESSHADRRRSLSEISIPISALIAPHAPSLNRSSAYHMHDPRKPPKTTPTVWSLRLRSADEEGSPLQAWCFFIGFILFPIWWVASFSFIPKTREVGGTDTEKAVTLDDPQVERDARTWRTRCRIMAGISFLTYIPFIVLVAVFVPR